MPILRRKTILLTGATGVLGQSLLDALRRDHHVICLMRKHPERVDAETVCGDVAEPALGLAERDLQALGRRIDWIVHSAAVTRLDGDNSEEFERVNCGGTGHVLDFAEAFDVPLYYISTAFVGPCKYPPGVHGATPYEIAKCKAEAMVRQANVRSSIFRPSIVIGDSDSGYINSFQGFLIVLGLMLTGVLAISPCPEDGYVDFIARDIAARAVANALNRELIGAVFNLTSGSDALRVRSVIDVLVAVAAAHGIPFMRPKTIDPEMFDRLIKPAFWGALPPNLQSLMGRALPMCRYTSLEEPLESSLAELVPGLAYDETVAFEQLQHSVEFLRTKVGVFERLFNAAGERSKSRRERPSRTSDDAVTGHASGEPV